MLCESLSKDRHKTFGFFTLHFRKALFNFYFLIFNCACAPRLLFTFTRQIIIFHSQFSIYFLFTIITLISITARPASCISVTSS